jgi:hypothetical protein
MPQDPETKEWKRKGPEEFLVYPTSATCGRHWENSDDFRMNLEGDHSNMVKFSSTNDTNYQKVMLVLDDFVKDASRIVRRRFQSQESDLGEAQ